VEEFAEHAKITELENPLATNKLTRDVGKEKRL
jgi:hypothetical protein